jgi:hypothetical protein
MLTCDMKMESEKLDSEIEELGIDRMGNSQQHTEHDGPKSS